MRNLFFFLFFFQKYLQFFLFMKSWWRRVKICPFWRKPSHLSWLQDNNWSTQIAPPVWLWVFKPHAQIYTNHWTRPSRTRPAPPVIHSHRTRAFESVSMIVECMAKYTLVNIWLDEYMMFRNNIETNQCFLKLHKFPDEYEVIYAGVPCDRLYIHTCICSGHECA